MSGPPLQQGPPTQQYGAPPTQPTQPTQQYGAPPTQQYAPPSGGWQQPPSGGWSGAGGQPPYGAPPYGAPPAGGASAPGWGVPSGPQPYRVKQDNSRKALIGVVAVVAVVAAGFAAVNLRAGGRAGASSPEAAVGELFAAVSDEDLIGVMEEVAPAERDAMVSWFRGLESNLSDLGIIEDVDLSNVSGADLEVEGLESRVEEVMPGVARVHVTDGELSFVTEPDAVPVGDVLEDLIEANGGEVDIERSADEIDFGEVTEEAEADGDEPVFLVATEQDGRWYLSLSYTIAEYARLDAELDPPDPDAGVEPDGADSAEEAASEFLTAAVDLDVERLISLLPPDEMGALQTYAPLFLEDAEESAQEFRDEEGYDASIEGLELDTSGVDGGTRVIPTAGTGTFSFDDGEVSISLEDGCIEASGEVGEEYEDEFGTSVVCRDDLGDVGGDLTEEERAEVEELGALFSDYQPGLVVVERDGAFYIDPLRTFSDLSLQLFDGIEREDLEEGGILFRIFTGDSVLFPEDEEGFDEDFDEPFDDEDSEEGFEDEGVEDPLDEDLGDDPADDDYLDLGPDYDVGWDAGYAEGTADGGADAAAGTFDASYDDTPPAPPPDVVDAADYDQGYSDGYVVGYMETYDTTCDPAVDPVCPG